MRKLLFKRFFEKVKKSGNCWHWIGAKNRAGYGNFGIASKFFKAHRVSWMLHFGQIPEGMHVLHKCDNPSCVNPEHLWIGTHKENMKDRDNKGRGYDRRGENSGSAVLTEKNVKEIRNSKESLRLLAKKFGVNKTTIAAVKKKRTWKHIHE